MEEAFILISGRRVQPVTIARSEGEFCIVEFGSKRIRVRASRIYRTEEEAKAAALPDEPLPDPDFRNGIKVQKEKSLYEQGY